MTKIYELCAFLPSPYTNEFSHKQAVGAWRGRVGATYLKKYSTIETKRKRRQVQRTVAIFQPNFIWRKKAYIHEKQISPLGHHEWTIRVTEWVPRDWKCSRGRPKTRWGDKIRKLPSRNWTRLAQERVSGDGMSCSGHKNRVLLMMMSWALNCIRKAISLLVRAANEQTLRSCNLF